MMHGVRPVPVNGYTGYVPPNPRLGIPALTLADGRAGVGNRARDVTLLPASIAVASSWDTNLMNTYGKMLGREQRVKGTNAVLAPSIVVVRVPLAIGHLMVEPVIYCVDSGMSRFPVGHAVWCMHCSL